MMGIGREGKVWIGLGAINLAGVLAFVLAAIVTLVAAGGAESSWPPVAYLLRVTIFTIAQAVASTALSVVLAMPVALALARRASFPGRSLMLGLMLLPLGLPVLPVVFGIVEIWGRQGLVNDLLELAGFEGRFSIYGLAGILLAHVFFNLPLAARLMTKALAHVPRNEWRLAVGLDFNRIVLFRFVEWPALVRVIPGIAGLIFMLCITSFTIILTLGGGPRTSTLEVAIYQALKFEYDPPRALALSVLQLGLTSVIFMLLRLFPDPEEDRGAIEGTAFRIDGRTALARIGDGAQLALLLLFVGAPMVAIVVGGLKADLTHLIVDPLFARALLTSAAIAIVAGLLSVTSTYLIIRARMTLGQGRLAGLFLMPEFMLLVPPLALGSGWFILLLGSGMETNAAMPVVVVINMLMAMPFTARAIAPELRTHQLRTGRLAESLDINGFNRLRLIDWPALKAPLLTALSFAMSLSLGDMGAIALFGSQDFITLPALLYAKLGSYRSDDAAGLSLILGGLCLVLMLPAVRVDRRAGERS